MSHAPFMKEVQDIANGLLKRYGFNVETSTTNGGALSTGMLYSDISSAGAESRTLAAPTMDGQLKVIQMTVHGGNVTLAGTNIDGQSATTGTFTAVGSFLVLLSVGGKWVIVYKNITFA